MPESEEYIRGMRAACEEVAAAIDRGTHLADALIEAELKVRKLAAENAESRTDRSKWPDGGGW